MWVSEWCIGSLHCVWLHELEAASLRMNWAFLPRQPIRVGRSCVVLPDWRRLCRVRCRVLKAVYIVHRGAVGVVEGQWIHLWWNMASMARSPRVCVEYQQSCWDPSLLQIIVTLLVPCGMALSECLTMIVVVSKRQQLLREDDLGMYSAIAKNASCDVLSVLCLIVGNTTRKQKRSWNVQLSQAKSVSLFHGLLHMQGEI